MKKQQLPFHMPQKIYVDRNKETGATTTIAVNKSLTLNEARQIIRTGSIIYVRGFQSKHETRARAICQLNGFFARYTKQAPYRVSMFL